MVSSSCLFDVAGCGFLVGVPCVSVCFALCCLFARYLLAQRFLRMGMMLDLLQRPKSNQHIIDPKKCP